MSKVMTVMGLVVSAVIVLVFAADAILGIPFSKASLLMDLGFIACGVILGIISWLTFRDLG